MKNKSTTRLRLCAAFALTLGWSGSALAVEPPAKVALTGARIISMAGPEIEDGVVLVEHGRITAVGKRGEVEIPFDAREFELDGKVLMPGLIVAETQDGLDVPNESRPVVPQLDAADAIDPSQLAFEDALRCGITTMHIIPGANTVIGGAGQIVRPIGMSVSEMTIAEGDFLKLAVGPRRGSDRMSQMAQLREAFAELNDFMGKLAEKKYEEKKAEAEEQMDVGPAEARKRGRELIEADDLDDQHRNLVGLVGGSVQVEGEATAALVPPLGAFIHCEAAMDVGLATRVAKEQNFIDRTVLVIEAACHKAIKELQAAARPVVLRGDLFHREKNPLTGEERETFVPKTLADAGLMFALVPGDNGSLPERFPTYQAARCVRFGVPRDVALRAITLQAAKIIGLGDDLGSIETGKRANFVVFTGDPLDFNSVVEWVFIDGVPAYERESDIRLKRLLSASRDGETKAGTSE